MIVQIILLTLVFVVCVGILYLLKLNKKQVERIVYYQYKYIPEPLLGVVKIIDLK